MTAPVFVGIDVGRDCLDVGVSPTGEYFNVSNDDDGIDDVIVGIFGLIGIAVLFHYRREMQKFTNALPFFVAGFAFLLFMVVLDILTNRDDILMFMTGKILIYLRGDSSGVEFLKFWLSMTEDMFKLVAEFAFLIAFLSCHRLARNGLPKP